MQMWVAGSHISGSSVLQFMVSTMEVKDTFFITHGVPMAAIDESWPSHHFFNSWKEKVYSHRPKAILMVSAHWVTAVPTVNVVQHNDLIYDFNEDIRNNPTFTDDCYELKYTSPAAPELAKRVKELLLASGLDQVEEDETRGIDHSAWTPLMMMYPEGDIPVCQISVQPKKDATYHYNLGKALAPLKKEGIVVIGSGHATHNAACEMHLDGTVASWASEFDTWLKDALLEGRYEDVNDYEEKAPHAKKAHPTPEHFLPLHVAMGAAGENPKAKLIHHSWARGIFSYASYQFTTSS